MKWIKEFPFRDGDVCLLMVDKSIQWRPKYPIKKYTYKVVEDSIYKQEYKPNELPCYFKKYVEKGKMVYRILDNGNYETFSMSRANFSNVIAYIFKKDMIANYESTLEEIHNNV